MKRLIMILLALLIVTIPVLGSAQTKDININTANIKTLTHLKQIGLKYAKRIINYREANGPFAKPEDIQKVSGIGSKIYEANKEHIMVGEQDSLKNKKIVKRN